MRTARTIVLFAAAVSAMATLGGSAGTARAAISPCGTLGNYFSGAWVTGTTQRGVQANLSTYSGDLCGSSSTSSAWVGEQDPNSQGIVQIGYVHAGSTSTPAGAAWTVFDEKRMCTNCTINITYFNITPSGSKAYKVGYDTTNLRFNLWYDGSELDNTTWDPISQWGNVWQGAFTGETWHCNTDVPGTSGTPMTFSGIVKKGTNGTWSQIDDLVRLSPDCSSRYHNAWVTNPNSFKIYTDPLS